LKGKREEGRLTYNEKQKDDKNAEGSQKDEPSIGEQG